MSSWCHGISLFPVSSWAKGKGIDYAASVRVPSTDSQNDEEFQGIWLRIYDFHYRVSHQFVVSPYFQEPRETKEHPPLLNEVVTPLVRMTSARCGRFFDWFTFRWGVHAADCNLQKLKTCAQIPSKNTISIHSESSNQASPSPEIAPLEVYPPAILVKWASRLLSHPLPTDVGSESVKTARRLQIPSLRTR